MKRAHSSPQTRSLAVAATVVFALHAVGCTDNEPSIAPDPPAAASDHQLDASPMDVRKPGQGCPEGLPGPVMAEVPAPDGTSYCIDTTEVTQGHYFAFIEAKGGDPAGKTLPDSSGQPPECKDNVSFGPPPLAHYDDCSDWWPPAYDPTGEHPANPVGCVDWCDAVAYCTWAGKRLCGRIGGGASAPSELANAQTSQWYNACSQGGTTAYSFGNTFVEGVCPEGANPVTEAPCAPPDGPFSSIDRLSGGLGEWEDACEERDSGIKFCRIRGGCYIGDLSKAERTACDCEFLNGIRVRNPSTGFRCCLD